MKYILPILILFCLVPSIASAALADSLVSYWKFDSDNSTDSVGTNNGTDTSITYNAGNGKINNGAGFGGASQIKTAMTGMSTFSTSVWFKFTTGDYLLSLRNAGNNANYNMTISGAPLKLHIGSWDGSSGDVAGATTLSTGTWYHAVGVFNGASSIVYLNGASDGTGTLQTHTSGTDFWMGSNGGISYTTGAEDEVAIWSRALTSGEVSTLYNGGAGNQYPFTEPSTTIYNFFSPLFFE